MYRYQSLFPRVFEMLLYWIMPQYQYDVQLPRIDFQTITLKFSWIFPILL